MSIKNLAFWLAMIALVVVLFNLFTEGPSSIQSRSISYSDFLGKVEAGEVSSVVLDGERVVVFTTDGGQFTVIKPQEVDVTGMLVEKGVKIEAKSQEPSGIMSFVAPLLPFLILIGVWFYLMNRMQGGGRGGAMGFGKSKAKLLTERRDRVTFDNVAGIDEAKEEVEEIVEFLKDTKKYSRLGARIPKGALLVGPPGTGKTLLARAIAGEAEVPFFSISGSDFVEMFVGVGASRVRDMFEQAKKNAPCIVFIDEIDAVGRSRGIGIGGGNDEREQTLNQLLVEMDGFEENDGVIIIAATNRPDVLDSALRRPGRFDRQIYVPNPDITGRKKILGVHVTKRPLGPDVDLGVIARGTPGFSGADLANLVNEAALRAARVDRSYITMEDFEQAKDKVMLGSERRSMVMTEEERRLTAFHEAGHALVGMNVPQHDPVYKVSIIPRGAALGIMMSLPEKDQLSVTFTKYLSIIKMAMGGKIAEELVFGAEQVTSGAASDIKKVTGIARQMVAEFGMSPKLGNLNYAGESDLFSGSFSQSTTSEDSKKLIEEEARRIVEECGAAAKSILEARRDDLDRLASGLLEYETLTGEEIKRVLAGESLDRGSGEDMPMPTAGTATAIPKTKRPRPRAADATGGRLEPEPT